MKLESVTDNWGFFNLAHRRRQPSRCQPIRPARWRVRGFHAALYREPVADGTQFMTSPPLASADMETGQVDPVHDVVPHFVRPIR